MEQVRALGSYTNTTFYVCNASISLCFFIIDSAFFSTSISIESSSVQKNGSVFKIWCAFKEGKERASCVVIYREYGNKTLVVKEYEQNSDFEFPVTFTVDHPNKTYTLAVFGKNGLDIDKRPYYFMAEEGETSDEKKTKPVPLISGALILDVHVYINAYYECA